jgi:hypothetical protein
MTAFAIPRHKLCREDDWELLGRRLPFLRWLSYALLKCHCNLPFCVAGNVGPIRVHACVGDEA